jgi:hypothetical protein
MIRLAAIRLFDRAGEWRSLFRGQMDTPIGKVGAGD